MTAKIFLYNNGTRHDLLFSRALYREVLASEEIDAVLATCRGDAILVEDLVDDAARILESDYCNSREGAVLDLAYLQPEDRTPVSVWLDEFVGQHSFQWYEMIDFFNDRMQQVGIDFELQVQEDQVPMLDFTIPRPIPDLRRPTVYVDTRRGANPLCHFVFDLERMSRTFPHMDFLCTHGSDLASSNLIDGSNLDCIQLSYLSNQCDVLLGMTWDPFQLTLTEDNRYKPKALCGYDPRITSVFYDYPGNPLEILASMDEVMDFLLANLWERN